MQGLRPVRRRVPVRRDQDGAGSDLSAVLVAYSSIEGHTARIAQRIAEVLRSAGHRVDLLPAGPYLAWSDYAGVIVGASVHYGHHPARLCSQLHACRNELANRPSAFFSVSLGAKEHYAKKFLRRAGWRPQLTAVFRGALQYSRYGPIKRRVVQAFAAVGGHDTDTSRDYDYTDWKAVDSFATAFSALVT
ncbi:MAG TPA: flavodoxin domain-containing protein [Burkholderiales bacterium]|nr:flavodoxin domain-containing protein [Burkholderiales bacterium]